MGLVEVDLWIDAQGNAYSIKCNNIVSHATMRGLVYPLKKMEFFIRQGTLSLSPCRRMIYTNAVSHVRWRHVSDFGFGYLICLTAARDKTYHIQDVSQKANMANLIIG